MTHDRPWTCDVVDCEYRHIGFVSRQMRDRHLDKANRVVEAFQQSKPTVDGDTEKIALLKALIKKNKLVKGSAAMQIFEDLPVYSRFYVVQEAACNGTHEVMEILFSEGPLKNFHDGHWIIWILHAMESQNCETLRWFQTVAREPTLINHIHRKCIPFSFHAVSISAALMRSDDPEGLYPLVESILLATLGAN